MTYNNFPQQLREQKQWVLWKKEKVGDKFTKVPYKNSAQKAASTKPTDWITFEYANNWIEKFPENFSGIGYVFNGGVVGIDLDHCFEEDGFTLKQWAKDIIALFPSYVEISPSGNGLHIFILCDADFKGAKTYIENGDIERYCKGRYFTVTGNVYGDYKELKVFDPDFFLKWHNSFIKEEPQGVLQQDIDNPTSEVVTNSPPLPDDKKILQAMFKSRHGAKLKDLYEGNWEKHFKKEDKKSQSEADLCLVGALMFFCCNNTITVDRIFRSSGLMREKWNREDIRDTIFKKTVHEETMTWSLDKIEKTLEQKIQREQELQLSIISLSDFLAKQLPPSKWVCDNLIPEGMTILSSAPGQYKTYMLLSLAKQISIGQPAFGEFKTEKRNVLFINEEMGENSIQNRLKTLSGEYGNIYMTNLAGIKLDDIQILLKICKEKNITLVIFDSLTRIHSLKENDADDVKKIFEAMLQLLRANISIIMTHHHRKAPMFGAKNGSEEMRGSIDILAQIDCHLAIDQVAIDKSYVILRQLKIRIAENIDDFKVKIEKKDNQISFNYGGSFSRTDETKIKIAMNRDIILKTISDDPGLNKDEITKKLGGQVSQMAVKATLLELEKENTICTKTLKPKTYYIKDEISTLI